MHPQQLRHTYMQCVAETDRRVPAGPPHRNICSGSRRATATCPRQLEAFFKARDAYMAGRHLHNEALAAEVLAPDPERPA